MAHDIVSGVLKAYWWPPVCHDVLVQDSTPTGHQDRIGVCFVLPSLGPGGAEYSLGQFVMRTSGSVRSEVVYFHHRDEGIEDELAADPAIKLTRLRSTHWIGRVQELKTILRESQPDLVVSSVFEADIVTRLARLGRRHPVGVSTIVNSQYGRVGMRADPQIPQWKLQVVRAIDATTARLAQDYFHAITEATATSAKRRLRVRPDRIRVVPRGRDRARLGEWSTQRRLAVRNSLGLAHDRPVLLAVGRREFQKGHLDLIRSLPAIKAAIPDLVLLLAGRQGSAAPLIDELIRELGLTDQVQTLGHRDDVADLMVAADLFVFPSLWEGFGGVVAEAMALGLPMVATAVPEVVEVLGNGRPNPAVVVPIGDSAAIARAVIGLLGDQELRKSMGSAGRARFEENFDLDTVAARTIEMYRAFAEHGRIT